MGYDANAWSALFGATVAATAALAGLVFVGISINLDRVMGSELLVERAAETFLAVVSILLASTLGLVPGQSSELLGLELLVLGAGTWGVLLRIHIRSLPNEETSALQKAIRIGIGEAAAISMGVSGLTLLVGRGGGLSWMAPAIVLSLCSAFIGAWVLLVEVRR